LTAYQVSFTYFLTVLTSDGVFQVLRVHQRMSTNFSKQKEGEVLLRMEALKANDMDAYYEMLSAAQEANKGSGKGSGKYEALTSFLEQTEEYLNSLGTKIAAVKLQQQRSEAAAAAAAMAKAEGASDEQQKYEAEFAAREVSEAGYFAVYLGDFTSHMGDFTVHMGDVTGHKGVFTMHMGDFTVHMGDVTGHKGVFTMHMGDFTVRPGR
jgi:uncharacterized glyoxalase superfamily metalloenzyme YdcJ